MVHPTATVLFGFYLILAIPLFLIQEAAGRIGIATGQGLGEVIRKNYTKGAAIVMSMPMAATDVLSYIAEYAGIAIGFELLGSSSLSFAAGCLHSCTSCSYGRKDM